jgi:very-short-patch-repair endonuclease
MADDFIKQCVDRCIASALPTMHHDLYAKSQRLAAVEAAKCESPLEVAFMHCFAFVDMIVGFIGGHPSRRIVAQVDTGTGHRVDFQVFPPDGTPATTRFAIELDGHEFHEKTREQVARRNERDRILIAAGWQVIRFSGSEFNRDPLQCIFEVRFLTRPADQSEAVPRG